MEKLVVNRVANIMMMKNSSFFTTLIFLFFIGVIIPLIAQENVPKYTSFLQKEYANRYIEEALHHPAYIAIDQQIHSEINQFHNHLEVDNWKIKRALSNLRQDNENARQEVLNTIDEIAPHKDINAAYWEIADSYFQDKDYENALKYLQKLNTEEFDKDIFEEYQFKKAYSYFVRKNFTLSKALFFSIKDVQNKYYYPANYYYAMTAYFTGDLEESIDYFRRIEMANAYKTRIPFYITQILFAQKKYEDAITYGESSLANSSILYQKEIKAIVGQSYFEKGMYEDAIPYLKEYIDSSEKLRAEDFYQLAFAYYQTEQYPKAIPYFEELIFEDSEIGQSAYNYLAKCYLQVGNKEKARVAFKRTSDMSFIFELADEAKFNYGKLSAEMGYDREALQTLKGFINHDLFGEEAQKAIAEILVNTADFNEAISYIKGLHTISEDINAAYQELLYRQAMQLLSDKKEVSAYKNFIQIVDIGGNNRTELMAFFRLAYMEHNQELFQQSADRINRFFTLYQNDFSLPEDMSIDKVYYLQGYNYVKLNQLSLAKNYFSESIDAFGSSDKDQAMKMDAMLRAGDCFFQEKDYDGALNMYNKAIKMRGSGTDYALFQRGIIQGLKGQMAEKIVTMESLATRYPKSTLADHALFQASETLFNLREYRQAQQNLNWLIERYPNSVVYNQALLQLGLISFNQGSMQTAASYYQELFNHNPNAQQIQEAILSLEEIYIEQLKKPEEYLTFVEQVGGFDISEYQKDSIQYLSAQLSYNEGLYAQAIDGFNRYIDQYPSGFNRLKASYFRAESFLQNKSYERAFSDFEYIIEQGPSEYYVTSLEKAAIIAYDYLQDFEKSYQYYSTLEKSTNDLQLQYNAQVYAMYSAQNVANYDGLLEMSGKILDNPLSTDQDRTVTRFFLGKYYASIGKSKEALENLNKVIPLYNNEQAAEARFIVATIIAKDDDIDLAEKTTREAIKLNQSYPFWVAKSLILLSDIFIKKNDLLQARGALEAVLENYTSDEKITGAATEKLKALEKLEQQANRVDDSNETDEMIMEKTDDK